MAGRRLAAVQERCREDHTGGGGRDRPGGVVVLAGCVGWARVCGAVWQGEVVAGSDNPVMPAYTCVVRTRAAGRQGGGRLRLDDSSHQWEVVSHRRWPPPSPPPLTVA